MALYEMVTGKAVRALVKAGWAISAWDGEEYAIKRSTSSKAILAECFHTDDILLECRKGKERGWVQFYFENGAECLSDYTVNLEEVLKPVNTYAEGLH